MAEPTTTEKELVRIAGRGGLVNIQIDDTAPIQVACRTLRERLGRDRRLYSHGEVVVDIGQRILLVEEQDRIRKVIESESGLVVKQFWCEPSVLERERERISALMTSNSGTVERVNGRGESGHAGGQEHAAAGDPNEAGTLADSLTLHQSDAVAADSMRQSAPADIVRGTCRAGQVLRFPGNVVVVGNVNPGAQIVAQGDILIFGTLRGTAHAGAGGDYTAVILAMSAASPQLRIADFMAVEDAPRGVAGRRGGDTDGIPVIARVHNRAVRVSPYLKNHSIDHGGNPNER